MSTEPTQREIQQKAKADQAAYEKQQHYNSTVGGLIGIIIILVILLIIVAFNISTDPLQTP
jgi:uncharacterized membrane protein